MNPLRLKSPKKNPVKKDFLKDFKVHSERVLGLLYKKNVKFNFKTEIVERLEPILAPIKFVSGMK